MEINVYLSNDPNDCIRYKNVFALYTSDGYLSLTTKYKNEYKYFKHEYVSFTVFDWGD